MEEEVTYEIYSVNPNREEEVIATVNIWRWVALQSGDSAPGFFVDKDTRRILQVIGFGDLRIREKVVDSRAKE